MKNAAIRRLAPRWNHSAEERFLQLLSTLAFIASYLPRLIAAFRFKQPLPAALFHPLAIFLLLAI